MISKPAPSSPDSPSLSELSELLAELPASLWADGRVDSALWDAVLLDPARDILSRSGKGFRARLLEHSWEIAGGDQRDVPDLLPVIIELLHVGSLIVDDIQDDSSQRRGEESLHLRYGIPIALNTGNWLYFLSLALLTRLPLDADRRLALHQDVSLGLMRCHHGQALDLSVRVTETPRADVPALVRATTELKTGALMGLAATLGARAAGGSPDTVKALGVLGTDVGVGLQMLDDWSGIYVDARRDKGIEDLRHARATWPWAWLAGGQDQLAYAETMHALRGASIEWELDRIRGRLREQLATAAPDRIQEQLASATSRLLVTLGADGDEPPGVDRVKEELALLRNAYE